MDFFSFSIVKCVFFLHFQCFNHPHADSWGNVLPDGKTPAQFSAYDSYSQDVDNYISQHDDFLVLFAASNDGYEHSVTLRWD
jgi:hypothetical protein